MPCGVLKSSKIGIIKLCLLLSGPLPLTVKDLYALAWSTHRQLASLQQLREEALTESRQLKAEVQQLRNDLLGVTGAKEEAFRFLEAMQASYVFGIFGRVL